MGHLSAVHKWAVDHPIWLTFGISLLFFILSMYAKEIRIFLHFWPREKLHSNDRIMSGRRLETLQRVHGDAYQLLLYLAVGLTDAFVAAFYWSTFIYLLWLIFAHSGAPFGLWPTIFSALVGRIMQMNFVLKELCTYEKSVASIQKSMAYHAAAEEKLAQKKLAASNNGS